MIGAALKLRPQRSDATGTREADAAKVPAPVSAAATRNRSPAGRAVSRNSCRRSHVLDENIVVAVTARSAEVTQAAEDKLRSFPSITLGEAAAQITLSPLITAAINKTQLEAWRRKEP